jgi:hypothetical protein
MFYAEENKYGLNARTIICRGGREQIVSAGNLFRFSTATARDAFVADDARHRESLTARQARKFYATGDLSVAVWVDANAYGPGRDAGCDKFIAPKIQ